MLNSSDVLELFIGEKESNLGVLMGIDPIDSSIEMFLNQGRIKILLNKYQLEVLINNLMNLLGCKKLEQVQTKENERNRKKEISRRYKEQFDD